MKTLLLTIAFLALPLTAMAYDVDKDVAAKQPCMATPQAMALIQHLKSTCKEPPLRVYVNICKGQDVNSPMPGLVTRTQVDTPMADTICLPKGFKLP